MRKLLYTFIISAFIASCAPTKNIQSNDSDNTYGVYVQAALTLRPETLDVAGIDSMLQHDQLPLTRKWATASYVDEESGVRQIYRTLYDRSTQIIYTIKELGNNVFVVSKRQIGEKR